jgi:hypothetical protein
MEGPIDRSDRDVRDDVVSPAANERRIPSIKVGHPEQEDRGSWAFPNPHPVRRRSSFGALRFWSGRGASGGPRDTMRSRSQF